MKLYALKPLRWLVSDDPPGQQRASADTSEGRYVVVPYVDGGYSVEFRYSGRGHWSDRCAFFETAKVLAEDHHEQRVVRSLDLEPVELP